MTQEFSVSGDLALPGDLVLPLENCQAFHETYSVFFTNPDAWVSWSSGISIGCSWELDGMVVFLSGYTDGVYTGGDTGTLQLAFE